MLAIFSIYVFYLQTNTGSTKNLKILFFQHKKPPNTGGFLEIH